jgi:hypothetical protein
MGSLAVHMSAFDPKADIAQIAFFLFSLSVPEEDFLCSSSKWLITAASRYG